MISLPAPTVHDTSDPALRKLASALIGDEIIGVRYSILSGSEWPNGYRNDSQVNEADMAIELATSAGLTLRISWGTPGSDEGLDINLRTRQSASDNWTAERVDVTHNAQWRRLVGIPITEIAVAFYSYDGEAEDRPWSIRLGLVDRGSIAIALGEAVDDALDYVPTSLVAIFDDSTMRYYQVAESRTSAIGEIVLSARI